MPPPISDARRRACERRLRAGETFAAVASAEGVSKGWLTTLAREAGIPVRSPLSSLPLGGGRKSGGPRPAPRPSAPTGKASARPAAPTTGRRPTEAGEAGEEELPVYDPDALEGIDIETLDLAALEQLERHVAGLLRAKEVKRDARLVVVVSKHLVELRAAMHRLRPAPKVDPDLDPTNLHARQTVLERVRGMVDAARGRAVALGSAA